MRDIITIQVGNCGNQVANHFWRTSAQEHNIGLDGTFTPLEDKEQNDLLLSNVGVLFNETSKGTFKARSILLDNDPKTVYDAFNSDLKSIYDYDLAVANLDDAKGNWAIGHYTDGALLTDLIQDKIRLEAESCDNLHGVQMIHSTGGGTGSGLGTSVISKCREEYCDRIMNCYSVFPSSSSTDNAMELYNTMFAMHLIIENADMSFCFDNEGLYESCFKYNKIQAPTMNDFNRCISSTMSDISAMLRFPDRNNCDWRKIDTALVCFPRLHFFTSTLPVNYTGDYDKFARDLHNVKHMQLSLNYKDSKQLSSYYCMRGNNIKSYGLTKAISKYLDESNVKTVSFSPKHVNITYAHTSPAGNTDSRGIHVSNNTSISNSFDSVSKKVDSLLKSKAYLHKYTEQGVDEMEFTEASSNLADIVCEYKQYAEAKYDSDGEGEGEGDDY